MGKSNRTSMILGNIFTPTCYLKIYFIRIKIYNTTLHTQKYVIMFHKTTKVNNKTSSINTKFHCHIAIYIDIKNNFLYFDSLHR